MKHKLIAILLALTIASWAQTATPNTTPAPEQKSAPADAKAGCCDKMAEHADMHNGMACMRHPDASKTDKQDKQSVKGSASCCAGKDAKNSCCAGKEGKSCSKDAKSSCCDKKSGEGHEMACCSAKDGKADSCCGGMQCGKHDHEPAAPGN